MRSDILKGAAFQERGLQRQLRRYQRTRLLRARIVACLVVDDLGAAIGKQIDTVGAADRVTPVAATSVAWARASVWLDAMRPARGRSNSTMKFCAMRRKRGHQTP
jgi:hypothetical protein